MCERWGEKMCLPALLVYRAQSLGTVARKCRVKCETRDKVNAVEELALGALHPCDGRTTVTQAVPVSPGHNACRDPPALPTRAGQEQWGKSLLWECVLSSALRTELHHESAFLKTQMGNFYCWVEHCCPLPLQIKFPSGINSRNMALSMEILSGGSALLGELVPK